jgi:hypothetical protein
MTKDEAKQQGSRFYDSVGPCRAFGHVGRRYTSNSGCVECCSTEKRASGRTQWRANNTERRRYTDRAYAERNKERISAYHKERYGTLLKDTRLAQYQAEKQRQSELIKDLYLGKEMPVPVSFSLEDLFRQHIVWRIVNEVTSTVRIEYSSTGNRSKGQIDIYLPDLGVGVEVKLDAPYWSLSLIRAQVDKYERWLGQGNVYVTSPSGRWGMLPDDLIEMLKTRPLIQSECPTPALL